MIGGNQPFGQTKSIVGNPLWQRRQRRRNSAFHLFGLLIISTTHQHKGLARLWQIFTHHRCGDRGIHLSLLLVYFGNLPLQGGIRRTGPGIHILQEVLTQLLLLVWGPLGWFELQPFLNRCGERRFWGR